jgi:hypothetical protein
VPIRLYSITCQQADINGKGKKGLTPVEPQLTRTPRFSPVLALSFSVDFIISLVFTPLASPLVSLPYRLRYHGRHAKTRDVASFFKT